MNDQSINNQSALESLRNILREQSKQLAEKAQKTYETLAKTIVTAKSSEEEPGISVEANGRHEVIIYFTADFLKPLFPHVDDAQLEHAAIELSKTATITTNEAIQKINEISKEKLHEITADMTPDLLESNE